MTGKLQHELRKRDPFTILEQEAHLNLVRTTDVLQREVELLFKPAELTVQQYNVLRILRGSGGQGLACHEIGQRMITRDPDITRLLDRLEKRGLIERQRQSSDRRVVKTRISDAGLKILKDLDDPVLDLHRKQLSHLGRDRLKLLIELLELARERSS